MNSRCPPRSGCLQKRQAGNGTASLRGCASTGVAGGPSELGFQGLLNRLAHGSGERELGVSPAQLAQLQGAWHLLCSCRKPPVMLPVLGDRRVSKPWPAPALMPHPHLPSLLAVLKGEGSGVSIFQINCHSVFVGDCFCLLRQALGMEPKLVLNPRSSCLSFPSVGI